MLMWLEDILIPGLMILWLVLLLIIPFCAISLMGWALRPGVRAALRSMGYETCGKCGYWLRDLPDNEGRCPECGAPREAMTDDEG